MFEKRLIEKYLNTNNNVDPINGEPLTVEQLITLKVPKTVTPRPPNATSIPAILKIFQDEWDAVMLESFKLRQHTETIRQELSHSLYQNDAACRVIARLTRERDQARQALAMLQPAALGSASGSGAMEVDGTDAGVLEKIEAKSKELNAIRKQRSKAKEKDTELATPEAIKAFTQKSANSSLHSASAPGITAMDVHADNDSIVATGGVDKHVVVYNHVEERILSTFKGHTKKITGVILHPTSNAAISSSLDATVRVWNAKTAESISTINCSAAVTGISLHATGDYLLSAAGKSWTFSDLQSGKSVFTGDSTSAFSDIEWHPDGVIFGAGSENLVRIYDIKQNKNIHNFEGHQGEVTAIAFSENGYLLASAAKDRTVRLWDLRKLVNSHTIQLDSSAHSLRFDYSGSYLAVGGAGVTVHQTKPWEELISWADHTADVTAVRFGKHARSLITAGMDRTLRVYTSSQ